MPPSCCLRCGRTFTPPAGRDPRALCPLCEGPIHQEPDPPGPEPGSLDRRELSDLRLGLSPADVAALEAAVTWLSWAGGLGIVHAFTIGCVMFGTVSNLLGLESFGTASVVLLLLGILTAQLAAFVVLIRGAAAFTGRVAVVWAWVAFVTTLFLGFIHLGIGVFVSLLLGRFDWGPLTGAFLALVYLYAAVRALLTLLRPGVSRHLADLERRRGAGDN
jgi:hypothetical protein